MDNPFLYPKAIHQRTLNPPVYKNYKLYKEPLRQEFSRQCVYCRALDMIKGLESFGVDHYRPQKRFPHLATEYLNLFYACNRCNAFKGSYWPSSQQKAEGQFVPNPCEHVMFQHLRYRGGTVSAASATGSWTIELLDLNGPEAVKFRDVFLGTLHALANQISLSAETIERAKRKLKSASTADEEREFAEELERAKANLAELQQVLDSWR